MFKLDSLHRMLPRGSRRNKKTLENDSAHRPAETICSSECDSFTPSISRRVCFDEDENSYYDNDFAFEDYESVWYTKDDFSFFNQENKALIKCLRHAETETSDPEFWTRSLGRLYWAFQDATNPKALQPLLESTKVTLDDEVIGTEKSVIRAIARDSAARRTAILDKIISKQKAHYESQDQKAEDIGKFMKAKCRGSHLYAMYVAHVAAGMK